MAQYRRKPLIVDAEVPNRFQLMDMVDPKTGQRMKVPFPLGSIMVKFPNGQVAVMPEKMFHAEFEPLPPPVEDEDDEEDDGDEYADNEPVI